VAEAEVEAARELELELELVAALVDLVVAGELEAVARVPVPALGVPMPEVARTGLVQAQVQEQAVPVQALEREAPMLGVQALLASVVQAPAAVLLGAMRAQVAPAVRAARERMLPEAREQVPQARVTPVAQAQEQARLAQARAQPAQERARVPRPAWATPAWAGTRTPPELTVPRNAGGPRELSEHRRSRLWWLPSVRSWRLRRTRARSWRHQCPQSTCLPPHARRQLNHRTPLPYPAHRMLRWN
jgi:hypothetical protein